MNISLPRVRRLALVALGVAIAALLVATFYANRDSAQATHSPANKVWISASTLEEMHTLTGPGLTDRETVVLSRSNVKLSNPTDIRLSVTAECALWTNTATTGDDDSESKARVEMWITIDGKVVPVATSDIAPNNQSVDPNDQAGRGRVVFCNRANRMKTENIETETITDPMGNPQVVQDPDVEDDIVIRSYNRSRSANAFNWGAMDVGRNYDADGDNVVQVVVHARLAAELTDEDTSDNNQADSPAAKAIIGKRTLFIEPVKMANDATF